MKNLLNTIQRFGVTDETEENLAQTVKLLNSITLVTIGFGVLYLLISISTKLFELTYLVLLNTLLVSLVFLLNWKGYYRASRLFFLILVNTGLALNCFLFGKETGIHFFYLVSASLPFVFFKHTEIKLILLCTFISLSLFFVVQFSLWDQAQAVNNDDIAVIYNINLVASFVWTILNFYYVARRNHQAWVKINEKNEAIKNALDQKGILLNEVHHRVKNNLQVVLSLLNLQALKTNDEQTQSLFDEFSARIRSISSIHELLYSTKDFTDISLKSYIEKLMNEIESAFQNNAIKIEIEIESDIENVRISLEKGIPLGLIINEIVTNALKHAVVNNKVKIHLQLTKNEELLVLTIRDFGTGFDFHHELENSQSLGVFLVNALCEQLEGNLTFQGNSTGTSYSIQFQN